MNSLATRDGGLDAQCSMKSEVAGHEPKLSNLSRDCFTVLLKVRIRVSSGFGADGTPYVLICPINADLELHAILLPALE